MPDEQSPRDDAEVLRLLTESLDLVKHTADAQAVEVDEPDTRALEGEDKLFIEGERWERKRAKALLVAQFLLLIAMFILVVLWLITIPGLLLMLGFHYHGFNISDAVAIAYMTTTTVSVIGLFKIAASWLFSDFKQPSKGNLSLRGKQVPD